MQHRRLRNHAPPQAPRRAAPRGLPRGFRILSRISALSGPRYVTAERLHIYAPKTRVRTAHTPPHRRHASRAGSAGTRAARNSSNEHPRSRDNTTLRSVHAVDVHGRRRRRRRGRGLTSHRLRALAPLSLRVRPCRSRPRRSVYRHTTSIYRAWARPRLSLRSSSCRSVPRPGV